MSNNASKVFLGILALIFGALALFFGVKYGQVQKQNTVVIEEKKEVNKEYNTLTAEFETLKQEFEALEIKNEELNGQLSAKLKASQSSKNEVARLLKKEKLTQQELDRARTLIEQLKQEKNNLLTNVQMLTKENQVLKFSNDSLTQKVTLVVEEKTQLEADTAVLIAQKNEITAERDELAPKAEYGQVVRVNSILAEGVRYKNSGKEVDTKNYKRVEKVKVCFNLEANPIADAGDKEYMVRIIDPQGVAVYEEQRGSGVFTGKDTGEEMKYTTRTYVNYENEPKSVCLYWSQNTPFQKGMYTAEIYNKGYKVGAQQFELKSGL
ncbi:MAG: hypothetical protein KTR13_02200 [Saprospiraceae bacterium]|nr:hypothetical protein [Saprospiraceae bacterium]